MSSASYFQTYMRSIRYQTQHVSRYGKIRPSKRFYRFFVADKNSKDLKWLKENYLLERELAQHSDRCEAEIRYLKALEGFRRSASGPSIQNLIDAGHLSEMGSA